MGCFQVRVTEDVLTRACDDYCQIMTAQKTRRTQIDLREIVQKRSQAMKSVWLRWGLWAYVLVTGVLMGIGLYFQSTGATYFFGALFVLAVVIAMTTVFDKQFIQCVAGTLRQLDRFVAFSIQHQVQRIRRELQDKTPYVVHYEIQHQQWSSVSSIRGQTIVPLDKEMLALTNGSCYVLIKAPLSQTALFSIPAETDEQRRLIETNLRASGISSLDVRSIPAEITESVE